MLSNINKCLPTYQMNITLGILQTFFNFPLILLSISCTIILFWKIIYNFFLIHESFCNFDKLYPYTQTFFSNFQTLCLSFEAMYKAVNFLKATTFFPTFRFEDPQLEVNARHMYQENKISKTTSLTIFYKFFFDNSLFLKNKFFIEEKLNSLCLHHFILLLLFFFQKLLSEMSWFSLSSKCKNKIKLKNSRVGTNTILYELAPTITHMSCV